MNIFGKFPIAGRLVIGMADGVYASKSLPLHWVVLADGEGLLVAMIPGGWEARRPYAGSMGGLDYLRPALASAAAAGCGIPKGYVQREGGKRGR